MPCPSISPKLYWPIQNTNTNDFNWVQFVLVGSKTFWSGSNQTFEDYFFFNLVLNQNYLDSLNNFRTHRRTGQYSSKHIFFLHNNFQMEFLIFYHCERMKHWVKVNSNNLCSLKQVLFGLQKHMRFADPDSDKNYSSYPNFEHSLNPSSIYSWSIGLISEHEFFC